MGSNKGRDAPLLAVVGVSVIESAVVCAVGASVEAAVVVVVMVVGDSVSGVVSSVGASVARAVALGHRACSTVVQCHVTPTGDLTMSLEPPRVTNTIICGCQ